MKLPDDIVSYHARSFAMAIRTALTTPWETGRIQLNSIHSREVVDGAVRTFGVDSPVVLIARGNPSWRVRVGATAYATLRGFLGEDKWCEAGGRVVVLVDKNRQVVCVTSVRVASCDCL